MKLQIPFIPRIPLPATPNLRSSDVVSEEDEHRAFVLSAWHYGIRCVRRLPLGKLRALVGELPPYFLKGAEPVNVDASRLAAVEEMRLRDEVLHPALPQELLDAPAVVRLDGFALGLQGRRPLICWPVCALGKPIPGWRALEMSGVCRHSLLHLRLEARVLREQRRVAVRCRAGHYLDVSCILQLAKRLDQGAAISLLKAVQRIPVILVPEVSQVGEMFLIQSGELLFVS